MLRLICLTEIVTKQKAWKRQCGITPISCECWRLEQRKTTIQRQYRGLIKRQCYALQQKKDESPYPKTYRNKQAPATLEDQDRLDHQTEHLVNITTEQILQIPRVAISLLTQKESLHLVFQ